MLISYVKLDHTLYLINYVTFHLNSCDYHNMVATTITQVYASKGETTIIRNIPRPTYLK